MEGIDWRAEGMAALISRRARDVFSVHPTALGVAVKLECRGPREPAGYSTTDARDGAGSVHGLGFRGASTHWRACDDREGGCEWHGSSC